MFENEVTEADYLSTFYPDELVNSLLDIKFAQLQKTLTTRYNKVKDAKIGEEISCPVCGKVFTKKTYQQKFCCTKCKNKYWNTIRF